MTDAAVQRLRGLIEKATPRPWQINRERGVYVDHTTVFGADDWEIFDDLLANSSRQQFDNLDLLVALVNAAPQIADLLREAQIIMDDEWFGPDHPLAIAVAALSGALTK